MKTLLPFLLLLGACASSSRAARNLPAPHPTPIAFDGSAMPAFHVRNLAAARSWYAEVLGCALFYELPEMGWCELTTPAESTLLGLSENPAAAGSGDAFLGLGVRDMAAAKRHLVAQGVALEGDVIEIPNVVKLLYFKDADGNRLMFYEPLQAAN